MRRCSPRAVAVPPKRPKPTRTEVSRGIFLYQTPPYGDVGLDGNSIVITSTDGVLVFDSNGTPAAAAAVLAASERSPTSPCATW